MKETIALIMILVYDFLLLAGTAYLVEVCGWSMWTFLLAAIFFITTKSKKD